MCAQRVRLGSQTESVSQMESLDKPAKMRITDAVASGSCHLPLDSFQLPVGSWQLQSLSSSLPIPFPGILIDLLMDMPAAGYQGPPGQMNDYAWSRVSRRLLPLTQVPGHMPGCIIEHARTHNWLLAERSSSLSGQGNLRLELRLISASDSCSNAQMRRRLR